MPKEFIISLDNVEASSPLIYPLILASVKMVNEILERRRIWGIGST